MRPTMQGSVFNNDAIIYYRCFGQGKPVVLLHGNGEDYTCFEKQLDIFSKNFFVIAMDSRGHGSSSTAGKITIDLIGKDVVAVLDELNINKASLVGFSDGANAAISFALAAKGRLDKLVLAGANLYLSGVKIYFQLPTVFKYIFLCICSSFSKKAREKGRIIGLMVLEPHFKPKELLSINAPTLVLAGEKDLIKESHTRKIARSIKGSELLIIKGANHFVFDTKPIRTAIAIIDFLKK